MLGTFDYQQAYEHFRFRLNSNDGPQPHRHAAAATATAGPTFVDYRAYNKHTVPHLRIVGHGDC